jgi:hypothetical protein
MRSESIRSPSIMSRPMIERRSLPAEETVMTSLPAPP